ncbi:MAG: ABC transporter substrate-binding protein [Lachnospiraceae bacterium]|nr:ABC transporter substrate-binding protein [Lachnospiraceae bacterium]
MKKAMSMLLVLMMVLSMLTACGESVDSTEGAKTTEAAQDQETQAAEPTTEAEPEEVITLKWYFKGEMDKDTGDKERVLEEVNKLLEERYRLRIEVIDTVYGEFNTIINNVDAAQEVYDIRYVGGLGTYETLIDQGILMDITDLMKEYAPTRYAAYEDYWGVLERDGRIYACLCYQLMCNTEGIGVHEQYLDEFNIDINSLKDWDDIENLMKTVQAKYPDAVQNAPAKVFPAHDGYIGSGVSYCYISEDYATGGSKEGQVPQVVSYYATEEFREYCKMLKRWVDEGLVTDMYDAGTQDYWKTMDKIWTGSPVYKPGGDVEYSNSWKTPMKIAQWSESYMTSSKVMATMAGVSTTSEHPEAAVKLLEVLYADQEIFNMLVFGIEGEDYEVIGENTIRKIDNGYSGMYNWEAGDITRGYLVEGQAEDTWEQTIEINNNAVMSPLMDVIFDTTSITTQVADVKTVVSEHTAMLLRGLVDDADKAVDDFLAALEVAGIQDILDLAQAQINAAYGVE